MSTIKPAQFRAFLDAHGLTQQGFAELMGIHGRSGQRWVVDGPPPAVEMMVRLLTERPELLEVVRRLAIERDGDNATDGTDQRRARGWTTARGK